MELFILTVIIVLIFLTFYSKQNFTNISFENDLENQFKNSVENIENSFAKKKEIYYSFKVTEDKIFYSNLLGDCNSPFIVENINKSTSLFKYITSLIQLLLDQSNTKNKTNLQLINIENFKRDTIENGFSYKIEVFLLNHKKFFTNKYRFHLDIIDNVITVKNISILNAITPIDRFNCDENKKHCTGRDSSLKTNIPNINKVEAMVETNLNFSKVETQNKHIELIDEKTSLLKDHITLPGEPEEATFPCNKVEHTWDMNGVSNNHDATNDCYGNKYAISNINTEPYFHISLLNNNNFDSKNIDINHNFSVQQKVGYDH